MYSMAMELNREVGRNDVTQQFLELKLGVDFIVLKPMTKQKPHQSFSPYSRYFQDLYVQHRVIHFRVMWLLQGLSQQVKLWN